MRTSLPRYTRAQLAQIVEQLQRVLVDGTQVFSVQIINAATDRPIAPEAITGFGMAYLRIDLGGTVKNFPLLVDPE